MTQTLLRSILKYSPSTGDFVWLVDSGARKCKGKVAGTLGVEHPCVYISYKRRKYLAHRLAWLYVHGVWPEETIDHKDGNPSNNRLKNLRLATRSQQRENQHKTKGTNPYVGVYLVSRKGKQKVQAQINGKHLGYFKTPEIAREAYLKAKQELHTHLPE